MIEAEDFGVKRTPYFPEGVAGSAGGGEGAGLLAPFGPTTANTSAASSAV